MKILGNPWAVGLLGLGAVVVVVANIFHPSGPRLPVPLMGGPSPAVGVNAPPPMPGAAAASPSPSATPLTDIDMDYVRSHFTDWLTSTQRDPFLQVKPVSMASTNMLAAHPVNQLKLKAVWRQDGVSMIAINNGIYRVGDDVDGRKVQRIDNNGVWLESNGKRDFIIFDSLDSGTTANGAPPSPAKP